MMDILKNAFKEFLFFLFRIFPIKNNKIVVSNFRGKGYGDSLKYIVDKLLEDNNGQFDIVWLISDSNCFTKDGIRTVNRKSINSIYEQVTAHIWIDNFRKPSYVKKRKKQYYIMTWHSNIALKKVEKDVQHELNQYYVKSAVNDSKMIDVFLSGSVWETNCISNSFWYKGEILQIGYPRQDIFATPDLLIKARKKVMDYYHLDKALKVLFYTPTFRKSSDEESLNLYQLEWEQVIDALTRKFGENGLE